MIIKLTITTTDVQREAITEWLETVAGRYWWTFKGYSGWIAGVGNIGVIHT